MLTDGVELFVYTLIVEQLDRNDLSAAFDRITEAARMLDEREVDCIVSGGSPIYALKGVETEDQLIRDLNEELEAPISTSLRAHVDALDAVGAESLLVVTPYPEDRNAERAEYLENRGFNVAEIGGVNILEPGKIQQQASATTYRRTRQLASEIDEDFDTVYISCPEWNSADYIQALEEDLGCPVVADAQAQVWKAYQLAGINPPITGYGELFEQA
jgi:maleate isomerase